VTRPGRLPTRGRNEFAQARARAEIDTRVLRARAVRTVAGQAVDGEDRARLLAMLGLDDIDERPGAAGSADLESGLAGYVAAVARALRVPIEATGFEVSDTVTIYLGLTVRWPRAPGRDLMLAWGDRAGWLVAIETNPAEPAMALSYLGGPDLLPAPAIVERFVTGVLDGRVPAGRHPNFPPASLPDLSAALSPYRDRSGHNRRL
jgi:hypothetical protein